jgi:tetratricopeptide (TPR) repeat protein
MDGSSGPEDASAAMDPALADLARSELSSGLVLRDRGRLTLAVACFERAVAADPEFADAWFWLAVTRDNVGLEGQAIPAYRRALDCGLAGADRRAQALMWLASSLSKTGEHDGALAALAQARELGGYEPAGEYQRLRRAIWRRSAGPRRKPRDPRPAGS